MTDLFKEIIPSILQTKKNVLTQESDYVPFVVNRALSFHYDCILQANEMNRYPNTSKRMQYDYLMSSVRGYKRRYQPWMKRESDSNIELIKEYYGYSYAKAKEVLHLFTEEQLQRISEMLDKGGS